MAELDREPPDENAGGQQLDQAVDAERCQGEAPAAMPALSATAASTLIQPTVSHSRRNAARMRPARSSDRPRRRTPTCRGLAGRRQAGDFHAEDLQQQNGVEQQHGAGGHTRGDRGEAAGGVAAHHRSATAQDQERDHR